MNIYIYCPNSVLGVEELTKALGAKRLKRFDGEDLWEKSSRVLLKPGDIIVCWDSLLPEMTDVRILNCDTSDRLSFGSKLVDSKLLINSGVPTIECRPASRHISVVSGWLGRSNARVEGKDILLFPKGDLPEPDFYSKFDTFLSEYRVHSFRGNVILCGKKVPRDGFAIVDKWHPDSNLAHPWIRNWEGGWTVDYSVDLALDVKTLAHQAVKVLGLTFGIVDIGETTIRGLKVIGVNRSVPLDGNILKLYVSSIKEWIEEGQCSIRTNSTKS